MKPEDLMRSEFVLMPAHQRQQSSVFSTLRINSLPDLEEMMIYKPDDVKTIGNDLGVGEIPTGQTAVGFRQIHHHDSDFTFVWKLLKGRFQGLFRASQDNIIDLVMSQIAKSCGITLFASKEMLIDAQHAWTRIILASSEFKFQQ